MTKDTMLKELPHENQRCVADCDIPSNSEIYFSDTISVNDLETYLGTGPLADFAFG